MKYGYTRVSTREQNHDLQSDQLHSEGCKQIFHETASGAKTERPVLQSLLDRVKAGDVIVVWKLDRLGRSLQHLVNLVNELMEKGVGLKSLQDPIDTTNAQGRLIFNIFASLAEFERDLTIERTKAGLKAARARGRTGGRPKGLNDSAKKKAMAAEALYVKGDLSIKEITENLGISRATLYRYLRHQNITIGTVRKTTSIPQLQQQVLKISVHLVVENNSQFVRGKSRSRKEIEEDIFSYYGMYKPDPKGWDYELMIPYENELDLEKTIDEILTEASSCAGLRNGFIEADVAAMDGSGRTW
ncbi:MAG: recombinase family protein [Rhodothermales bacterium]